jgi:hypothetical protein
LKLVCSEQEESIRQQATELKSLRESRSSGEEPILERIAASPVPVERAPSALTETLKAEIIELRFQYEKMQTEIVELESKNAVLSIIHLTQLRSTTDAKSKSHS